eukprot:CAMPEP_0119360924 /NCGR_PEP_ID=MMETSP1334-20130426/8375_1 /TAXON_ID=127549 /ORGANISM="Calcidiscus leptoporus, Strain RCC1130" /LENGTH=237 /DNA_ID=CAMNT_0007375833 /DNA_START=1 /DNA_END=714 /DNA_ORIENTATION=-
MGGGLPAPGTRRAAPVKVASGGLPAPRPAASTSVIQNMNGTKVYVGNLSYDTTWQRLKDHFRQAGEVVHADVMQESSGRSKGCGLVTLSSPHEAALAIETLNESELDGRNIFVREDRENVMGGGLPAPGTRRVVAAPARAAPPPSMPSAAGGVGGTKVYVGNLSYDTTWQRLKDHFRQAGEVLHADVLVGPQGRSKGCGLVTLASPHDAALVIESLNESELDGRNIFVREDRESASS